jgi:hypothetical protein
MRTATTAVAAGNSFPVETASMELGGDGTINFKHFIFIMIHQKCKETSKGLPFS